MHDDEPLFLKDALPKASTDDEVKDFYRPPAPTSSLNLQSFDGDELELPLADLGQRFLGRLLDYVFYGMAFLPLVLTVVADGTPSQDEAAVIGMLLSVVALIGLFAYNTHRLVTQGQTLGKRIIGTRIVHFTGRAGTSTELFWLRVMAVAVLGGVLALIGLKPIWQLADGLFVFQNNRRTLHDLIASTSVVRDSFNPYV